MRNFESERNYDIVKWIITCGVLLIAALFPVDGYAIKDVKSTVRWHSWQHSLISEKQTDGKPCYVEIIYKGPGGTTLRAPAFTDDGKTYCFRMAFPSSGIWEWQAICSDTGDKGLHNKKGRVKVRVYTGNNPVYLHGDLKISKDMRYLVHFDDTPFLWMGETGWDAALKSSMEEWHEYIDIRASQKFSVIQVLPKGTKAMGNAANMKRIFFKEDGRPDPETWRILEDKIAYANEKGLFVLLTGLGGDMRDQYAENPGNQPFESYLAGRMAGLMVIFSPSMDQLYDKANDMVAEKLQKETLHLVTQHPGTNYEANVRYRDAASVDFCGLQSGHHGGNLTRAYNAARQWTLDMWNGIPVKPVINIEAMYDAYGNNAAKNWREKDARRLGWITWLSGARGYTYGCGDVPPKVPGGNGGIWKFNKDSTKYDFWRNAILWPGARQMTLMHDFFGSVAWWKLIPCHEKIMNQPSEETNKMVSSVSTDEEFFVAYLPDNNFITLNLNNPLGSFKVKWFNPVTGIYAADEMPASVSGTYTFRRPEGWEDAVLLLLR